ncbi:MAG: alpha/beta fold hydrolase [Cyanobacteria bacterium]|nr:alpha/beta fold hydrolase [Cyanobacteriota bacterium]
MTAEIAAGPLNLADIHGTPAFVGQYWQWQGHAIHYVQAGDAHPERPPLLLIHGFGASTDHWRKNIAELQADFEVWAIDLLGFGRSAKPAQVYSGALWRDQLQDFIQTKIGRPVVLAGNSLGGYASLCVAAAEPNWVAGVILLNSAGPFSEAMSPPVSPVKRSVAKAMRTLLLSPLPSWLLFQYVRQRSMIRKTLAKVYVDQTAVTDQLVEEIRRPADDAGAAAVFASVFKSPSGDKVDTLLARMVAPLLLLWGEGDPWMNTRQRHAAFLKYYPTLDAHFLAAGHCPHDEVPSQVNELMRNWVLGLAAGSPDQ